MITMVRVATIAFSLFILAACAAAPVKEGGKIEIKPAGIHEECSSVHRGQKIVYAFDASAPVDFNIHYHAGQKIFYPVEKRGVTSDSGKYEPETEDTYCLMWTNPLKEPVSVNYRYEVHSEVKPIMPPPSTRPGNVY
jgi:hypothetical protein